ncbi:exonuclease SbcCD subunit D C-terminal domain-containing protein [Carboxylicivirga sp. M1479]|uniref:exonuclease SbcCD subunit D C-terminal domain-containing protein n=1 Tax=Carboxylicivirga sp. M1479 TaxID=2594476 RepID=UPI0011779898|nr:exonuclease SbcCD subunit D C-terminal domain-containing protein [Carboxylicivirga sp. M1479]TRX72470.1 exonuclease subunit SbcD [Carboxylicivirga sp. M1479]
MRILHTSDWHIGQKLHGNDRDEEHELFFNWLIDYINEHEVDVLLVAGDIFDVGFPSNSALKRYYSFLTHLVQTKCSHVIITGGNHDYISTLEAPADVLSALNIHVIGGAKTSIEDEVIEIKRGEELECVIGAVPFLRDKDIRLINAGESYEEGMNAINEGIVKHYQTVADAMSEYECPRIAMGHLNVYGAKVSESERDIHIGNLAGFRVTDFPAIFDYVALGHIHRPQRMNETGTIRYSGSPIALSFSERSDQKKMILLDLDINGIQSIESVEIPCFRRLISFKGEFQQVAEQLASYKSQSVLCDWAEVSIEEKQMDTTLSMQYEQLIENINNENNNLQIVKPSLRFINGDQSTVYEEHISLSDLTITDVFDRLLDAGQVNGQDELKQTFTELLDGFYHQIENE